MSSTILASSLFNLSWQGVAVIGIVGLVLIAGVIGVFSTGRAAVIHTGGSDLLDDVLRSSHQETLDALSKLGEELAALRAKTDVIEQILRDVG
jgi:hypothetical protein